MNPTWHGFLYKRIHDGYGGFCFFKDPKRSHWLVIGSPRFLVFFFLFFFLADHACKETRTVVWPEPWCFRLASCHLKMFSASDNCFLLEGSSENKQITRYQATGSQDISCNLWGDLAVRSYHLQHNHRGNKALYAAHSYHQAEAVTHWVLLGQRRSLLMFSLPANW